MQSRCNLHLRRYCLSNNFSGVPWHHEFKIFQSLAAREWTVQCRRWTVTNIYYCWNSVAEHILLGHHTWPYLATILGHHDRKTKITVTHHLDTVSNRRSHQIISYLISWMSTYSETQANFKNPSYIFPGGPLSTHPSQTPNFLLTTNPFNPSQAKRSPSPAKICLIIRPKDASWPLWNHLRPLQSH